MKPALQLPALAPFAKPPAAPNAVAKPPVVPPLQLNPAPSHKFTRTSSFSLDLDDDAPFKYKPSNPAPAVAATNHATTTNNFSSTSSFGAPNPFSMAPVAAQPRIASREKAPLDLAEHHYRALPKSQYLFGDSLPKATLLPDIKSSNLGALYAGTARYQPIDLAAAPAAMFGAPKAKPAKPFDDAFPAYKPSIDSSSDLPALLARGVKANDVNRRTDWAAKYGGK